MSNSAAADSSPAVSPNGQVVVWQACNGFAASNCQVRKSILSSGSWSPAILKEQSDEKKNCVRLVALAGDTGMQRECATNRAHVVAVESCDNAKWVRSKRVCSKPVRADGPIRRQLGCCSPVSERRLSEAGPH